MAVIRTWRLGVIGVISLVLAAMAMLRPAGATGTRTGDEAKLIGTGSPGRSTIPHLSSRLAALAAHPTGTRAAQASVAGTPVSGAGSLQRQPGSERLLVEIRVAHWGSGVLARLHNAGAVVTHRAAELRTVTAAVAPADLRAIARVSGVQYVGDILAPQASGVCDATISEGDGIMHAVQERSTAGVDGTGVTVGILSDSFDTATSAATHAADDVTSDDLPGTTNTCLHTTPVDVRHDFTTTHDEGRAMAQIVHDLAPGAKIMFATAEGGQQVFADNIRELANHGADVIVDDINYFAEPVYQDGVVAKAVNDVRAQGVAYFSSAANNNILVGGHDVGSYEAVDGYRPTPCPAAITAHEALYTDCHSFDANGADPTDVLTTASGRQLFVTLDWAEPQFGVKTDYALCFLQPNGTFAFCVDNHNPVDSEQAVEVASVTTGSSLQVVVARYSGNNPNENATPRFKLIFQTNSNGAISGVEYPTPTTGSNDVIGPTIYGHNGTSGAVTLAASDVRVTTPSVVQDYSSRGPVTLLFGPVVGATPAAALAAPKVLAKPDITASHCGKNTYFGSFVSGVWRFCGTSAAAPHAAAVAALLLDQNPDLTPKQVTAALTSTAVDLSAPAATQGAGLVNAQAAGAAAPDAQKITFAQPAKAAVGGSRTLPATASSGLAVTFSVDAATHPTGACTLSGSHSATVRYRKAGSCVIAAKQSGNGLFTAAHTVKRTIVVKPAPAVKTKSLPSGVVGKKYAANLHSTGGNSPVTWNVTKGKLPPGLKLAKSGAISGKPTKAGSYQVTVSVTDSSAPKVSATKRFTIKINR